MGNNKFKILIVEDETNIKSFIKANLETSDYQVLCAETCELGMMMYASHHPDLILLDLGLPDRDGMSLIQEVRETDTVPIIVLSARSNERDKVEALDLGANDYITKPFGTEELLARIRAVLRSHRHSEEDESSPDGKFRLQDLLIDYDTRQVFVGKEEIDLTQTEYNIMAFLSVHAGKVLTYAAIIQAVWGYSDYGSVKKLQVNMKNIRKKMGVTPGEKRYIINELGAGYRVLAEDEAYRCQSFAPLDSRGTMQMSFFRFYTKRRRLIFVWRIKGVKRLVSLGAGAQIKKLPCFCAGQLKYCW